MSIYQILVSELSSYYVDIEAETEQEARAIYYTGEQEPEPYKEMTLETNIEDVKELNDD